MTGKDLVYFLYFPLKIIFVQESYEVKFNSTDGLLQC